MSKCPHCGCDSPANLMRCSACGQALSNVGAAGGSYLARRKAELDAQWKRRKAELDTQWQHRLAYHGFGPRPAPAKPAIAAPICDVLPRELTVTVEALKFVSFALHHVGIGPVRSIRIHNGGVEPTQTLVVEVSVPDYGEPWQMSISALQPGETWEQLNVRPPLAVSRLRDVNEKEWASIKIVVRERNEILYANTLDKIAVLAYNEWFAVPEVLLPATAALVQSNAEALNPVIGQAATHLEEATGSRAFCGYQRGDPKYVHHMISSIHEALSESGIDYIDPPPSFEYGNGQKVRLVNETLEKRRGTCMDLAVLQAALWEHIGLHPLIVLKHGHAFLACWMTDDTLDLPVVNWREDVPAAKRVFEALNDGALMPVNSVEIAHGVPLSQAIERGHGYLQKCQQAEEDVHFIDITAARSAGVTPLP